MLTCPDTVELAAGALITTTGDCVSPTATLFTAIVTLRLSGVAAISEQLTGESCGNRSQHFVNPN